MLPIFLILAFLTLFILIISARSQKRAEQIHQKFLGLGVAAFFIDQHGQLRVTGYKNMAIDESTDTMVFTRQQTEDIEGVLVNSIRKHLAIKEVRGKEEVKEAGKTT